MIYMKYPEEANSKAESRLVVAKSCGQGEMGNTCLINRVSFCNDENVLELNSFDSCRTLNVFSVP